MSAKVVSLDPLSPRSYSGQAAILYAARRYSEATDLARRSLQLAPNSENTLATLGDALLAERKFAEAKAQYSKLDPTNYRRLVGEAVIAARSGQQPAALSTMRALRDSNGDFAHYQYGEIYAQLGLFNDTFKELELAWEVRDPGLQRLRIDPFLDPIRADPRFTLLERKLNFP